MPSKTSLIHQRTAVQRTPSLLRLPAAMWPLDLRLSVYGTLRKTDAGNAESALLPSADHLSRINDVAFVPIAGARPVWLTSATLVCERVDPRARSSL